MMRSTINKKHWTGYMDEVISKIVAGISLQKEVQLLGDLKRLGELGVLQIEMTNPDIKHEGDVLKYSQLIGLKFNGEEEIIELRKAIDELLDVLKPIVDKISFDHRYQRAQLAIERGEELTRKNKSET